MLVTQRRSSGRRKAAPRQRNLINYSAIVFDRSILVIAVLRTDLENQFVLAKSGLQFSYNYRIIRE